MMDIIYIIINAIRDLLKTVYNTKIQNFVKHAKMDILLLIIHKLQIYVYKNCQLIIA